MKTAVLAALIVYALAAVITASVALMMKLIYWTVRLTQRNGKKQ